MDYLLDGRPSDSQMRIASVFIALFSLTGVLALHLQHIYHVGCGSPFNTINLELALNAWVDSLTGATRLIVLRGIHLETPGAANLRLAFLTTRLLLQRIQLEDNREQHDGLDERVVNRYADARRTSEDIVILTQELQLEQLGDFWMSISAFAFSSTANFLLRCALETNRSPEAVVCSGSFEIANELITTLKTHRDAYGWELGDVCLAQHTEMIDKISTAVATDHHPRSGTADVQQFVLPDASIIDQLFPSLWDPLQNAW